MEDKLKQLISTHLKFHKLDALVNHIDDEEFMLECLKTEMDAIYEKTGEVPIELDWIYSCYNSLTGDEVRIIKGE